LEAAFREKVASSSLPLQSNVRHMGRITVRVQPGASRDALAGHVGEQWKLAITAPPIEGRANKAGAEFLARLLGRTKREVRLVGGAKSRIKTFEVTGMSTAEIETKLAEADR
jgi:uncharacterized protein (TIGR00251 family)